MKMEAQGEKRPAASWVGTPRERASRPTPKEIKLEPEELCWEVRWQEYLRMLQDPDGGWRQLPFPRLPPGEDPEGFHTSSRGEAAAAINPLPKAEFETHAWPVLGGEAHGCGLDPAVKVKEETPEEEEEQQQEGACLEMWRQGFRGLPYQEAKGPREICRQLLGLCRQWLKPGARTVERILDLLVLEQFLAILPEDMQRWVTAAGARSCAQAVSLAEHFLLRVPKADKVEEQVLEPFEEVVVNSPETEWVLPETKEQHLLSVEAKPEGEAELFQTMEGNRQIVEEDGEICRPQRPEQAAVSDVSPERDRGSFFQTPDVEEGPEDQQGWKSYRESCPGENLGNGLVCREGGLRLSEISSPARIDLPVTKMAAAKSRKSLDLSSGRGKPRKESYECSYCGKKWPCQSQLLRHESIHTGEKPHRCAKCGKSFNRRSNLTTHERTHTGEKPHTCPQCGKSFIRRTHLTEHKRTHVKEKSCNCPGCRRSSSLTLSFPPNAEPRAQGSAHGRSLPRGRSAKPEEPLGSGRLNKCSYCGKSFSCHARFLRHEKSHTKERPYRCPDCGKSFCTSSNLSQHKRTHTGERPYGCRHCGKSYRRKFSLLQHEQETCPRGSSLSAPPVGFVVLGNCALLCVNEAEQAGGNRPLTPDAGESLPTSQPSSASVGHRP